MDRAGLEMVGLVVQRCRLDDFNTNLVGPIKLRQNARASEINSLKRKLDQLGPGTRIQTTSECIVEAVFIRRRRSSSVGRKGHFAI